MLNKTPKASGAKTKLAHKKLTLVLTGTLLVFALLFLGSFLARRYQPNYADDVARCINASSSNSNAERRPGCDVLLETALTDKEREQGLSGRSGLASDQGIVFIFDQPTKQCFWMKDMKFNIDIVWLDQNKKILKILPNLSPQTYPHTYCSEGTKYVIELQSGRAASLGLREGDTADVYL